MPLYSRSARAAAALLNHCIPRLCVDVFPITELRQKDKRKKISKRFWRAWEGRDCIFSLLFFCLSHP
jgi:hypothetical protein